MDIDQAIRIFEEEYRNLDYLRQLREALLAIKADNEAYLLFEGYRQLSLSIKSAVEMRENKTKIDEYKNKLVKNTKIKEYLDIENRLFMISEKLNDIIMEEFDKIYQDVYFNSWSNSNN